ncbi:MAG: 2OG-Fe(II) oxygenase [Acidimicrobiales bacterium]
MRRFSAQTVRAFVPEENRAHQCALVYPSVFSARQCQRIVDLAADLAIEDAHISDGLGTSEHDDELRRSRVAWIPFEEPFTWIHDKLVGVVRRANRQYDFDLIGFTEDLQFTEYEGAGSFHTWHQDGLDGELAARKLSMVVQLSDPADYEGGDLELFGRSNDDSDATSDWRTTVRGHGSVVAFPAFEFHRVTPLLSGTRRSLVCWIGGPPFR